MRLLFLNRSFWPDPEATGQLLTELCVDLSRDHDVTVVAGPSYHVPTEGRGLWQREALGRVAILRTWGMRLPKRRLLGRLLNLGSYYTLAAGAALRVAKPDVVIAETDPPLLGVLGAALQARWRCRFVYYCQDIYPDVAEVTGGVRNRALLSLLARANRLAYRKADLIVVPGRDMRQRLLRKGVPPEKIAVLPNWIDCDAVRPLEDNAFRTQFGDKFVVMYSGNIGLSQQLDTVLDAARRLRDDARILFVFIGEGARKQWLAEAARRDGLDNVRFFPYQPKAQLAASLGAADLHLVPLQAGVAGCLVPSKIYGVLAAARPFVALMEEEAEVAALAREFGVGFVSPPGDAVALVQIVQSAVAHPTTLKTMGRRARALAEHQYHRPILTRRFADLLNAGELQAGHRDRLYKTVDDASLL
ncbi:MAG TPA: glycosyltransferase family 4 protein [Candidatus Acidoferrales bacterium]|nr:glycosyltransferase family 4 protein [Candidatus Acidoferrales bacterium]